MFYVHNYETIGDISFEEFCVLVKGAITFDTVSIVYSSSLWLLLSLLPLRCRVKRWYQATLFWIYISITSLVVVTLNVSDAIYFHYAQKRFTASEMIFTDNGNNFAVALRSLGENWGVILVALLRMIAFTAVAYRPRAKVVNIIESPFVYYPVNMVAMLLAILFAIGGVRGGFSPDIRPLTLSNAMQFFTTESEKSYMILSNPFLCYSHNREERREGANLL